MKIDNVFIVPKGGTPVGTYTVIMAKSRPQTGKSVYLIRWMKAWEIEQNLMKIRQVRNEWVVTVDEPQEKIEWCREMFGHGGKGIDYRWWATWGDLNVVNNFLMRETITIRFRHKEDVAMFKLKFSC